MCAGDCDWMSAAQRAASDESESCHGIQKESTPAAGLVSGDHDVAFDICGSKDSIRSRRKGSNPETPIQANVAISEVVTLSIITASLIAICVFRIKTFLL